MKTTVIITNHNYGDLLGWSIGSAHQGGVGRIVVVDDASTDESRKWYDHFGDSIEVIRTQGPVGPAEAKNVGINHAWDDTDVFGFLDADDHYFHHFSAEVFLKGFGLSYKVGLVYADSEYIDEVGQATFRLYREPFSPERFTKADIIGGNFFVSKKALEVAGRFNKDMKVMENYELARRVAQKFAIIHVPECLTTIRRTSKALIGRVPKQEWEYYWHRASGNVNGKT
jgi:glycosyltransferase involved in cell wall biosynthesis